MRYFLYLLLLISGLAKAACPELYAPSVPKVNAIELCNSFFVIVYNEQKNRPIYVSERIKRSTDQIKRIDAFRSDKRIKNGPTNTEYSNSGYDRGHLAPAADSSNDKEMYDTFLLTNMTPQAPLLNRKSWKELEENIRTLVNKTDYYVYILTIPVYGNETNFIGRIPIPSGYWKVVYFKDKTLYYFADNKDNAKVQAIQNVDLSKLIK